MKLPPTRAPRFYVDAPLHPGVAAMLPEEAAHHAIHVMRLAAGDAVTLFNGQGGEYSARIASTARTRVAIDVLEHRPIECESPLHVALVQGVSSGDRMDFTIRKAVELGAAELRPVLTARSVARPKGERAEGRRAHWQKVAVAACEQCGRNRVPPVHAPVSVASYLTEFGQETTRLLLSPHAEFALSKKINSMMGKDIALAAGPEAGFDAEEEAAFIAAGFVAVRLGPRVLRTETAALAALAALNALRGDF